MYVFRYRDINVRSMTTSTKAVAIETKISIMPIGLEKAAQRKNIVTVAISTVMLS